MDIWWVVPSNYRNIASQYLLHDPRSFAHTFHAKTIDHILTPQAKNEDVYQEVTAPLVNQFLDGYNG